MGSAMPSNSATFIKVNYPSLVEARQHNQKFVDACNSQLSTENADYKLFLDKENGLEQLYTANKKPDS